MIDLRQWRRIGRAVRRTSPLRPLTPERGRPAGVPLVKIRCGGCGAVVAVIEDTGTALQLMADGARSLLVVNRAAASLSATTLDVECAADGAIVVQWNELWPVVEKARETHRAVTVRATPSA